MIGTIWNVEHCVALCRCKSDLFLLMRLMRLLRWRLSLHWFLAWLWASLLLLLMWCRTPWRSTAKLQAFHQIWSLCNQQIWGMSWRSDVISFDQLPNSKDSFSQFAESVVLCVLPSGTSSVHKSISIQKGPVSDTSLPSGDLWRESSKHVFQMNR